MEEVKYAIVSAASVKELEQKCNNYMEHYVPAGGPFVSTSRQGVNEYHQAMILRGCDKENG